MKNIVTVFILTVCLFIVKCHTQPSGWIPQTSGTTQPLLGLFFTDANNGTTVGGNGTILHTTNGGTTWAPQTSGVSVILSSVSFSSASTGAVVGGSGIILRTTDAGVTWTPQTSGVTTTLQSVSFIDADTGIVVGDNSTILRTTDGGITWNLPDSGVSTHLLSLAHVGGQTWIAVGGDASGQIFRSTNNGRTWTGALINAGHVAVLKAVSFADANRGIAVEYGKIYRTTNGGARWDSVWRLTAMDGLFAASFTDSNTATVAGLQGTMFRTVDGGNSWAYQSSGTFQHLYCMSFTDVNTGTVVGGTGTILHTTTGGVVSVEDNPEELPVAFRLEQNYPNPFNPTTSVSFDIGHLSFVSLKIFDVLGREVTSLVNEELRPGTYTRKWNGGNMPSGVYFCRLFIRQTSGGQAGSFTQTRKMLLLR